MKGDELAPEEDQALKSTESDTVVIGKVEGVSEPPFLFPATSCMYETGGFT